MAIFGRAFPTPHRAHHPELAPAAGARTASDTAGGTDVALIPVRSASDTAGGTDAATRVSTRARTCSDTAGGTDSAVGVFHAGGPLVTARAGFAAAGTTPCNIIVYGDSVTQGVAAYNPGSATALIDYRYTTKLARRLQTKYQSGGLGYMNSIEIDNNAPAGTAYWTWSNGDSGGFDSRNFNGEIETVVADETVTLHWVGTSIKFQHQRGTTGLGTLSVVTDGGAPDTITPTSTGGLDYQGIYTSATLSHGSHVTVVTPSTGKTPFICGVEIFDGDEGKGIRMWNHGRVGQYSGGVADMFSVAGLTDPLSANLCANPALCIIFLGINDCVIAFSVSSFQTNITQIIANTKSLCASSPSFLLLGAYDISSASGSPDIGPYNAALAAVAAADPNNVAYLDLRTIGSISMNDALHPDNVGHNTIANAIAAFVSTPIGGTDTAGGTDSATAATTKARTCSDTAGATDVAVGAPARGRLAADTAGGTDSATRVAVWLRTASDAAGGTDAATRTETFTHSSADTAGGTDGATRTVMRAATAADLAGGTDAAVRFVLTRTASDTAGGTDAAVRTNARVSQAVSDTAGGSDALTSRLVQRAISANVSVVADFRAQVATVRDPRISVNV